MTYRVGLLRHNGAIVQQTLQIWLFIPDGTPFDLCRIEQKK